MASRIAVLVTTLVAVRALDPAQFGLYIVLYAIALVAAALWDLGVSVVVAREVGSGRVAAGTALASASRLRVITLPAWFAALAVGLALVKNFPTLSAQVCVPFVLASAGAGMSVIALAALRGAHRFSSASAAQAAGKWSTAGLSALAIVAAGHGDRLFALGMAFAAGELLTFVVSIGLLATARNGTVQRSAPSISLRDSLPFAANAAMSMIYNRFDVVLVGVLASASAAGLYGAASRTQDALYAIPSALGAVAVPMIALVAGQGDPTLVRPLIVRFWKLGMAVALPVTAVVVVTAPALVPWVLGDDYSAAVTPVRLLVCFLPFAVIQAPLLAGLTGIGEGNQTTIIVLTALVTALILQLVLAREFGATGGAIASLGRDVITTPVALVIAYRHGLVGRTPTPPAPEHLQS